MNADELATTNHLQVESKEKEAKETEATKLPILINVQCNSLSIKQLALSNVL
jgi:hypothetical protein